MATIQRFEDLEVWKESRELNKILLPVIKILSSNHEYGLMNQLRNAAGSVMDNIAEGFDRGSRKEFVQFLGYSRGSKGEVKSQLYRVLDSDYISKNEFDKFYNVADSIGKMLNSLISYLNKSEIKGERFKNSVSEPTEFYGQKSEEDDLRELLSNFTAEQSTSEEQNRKL